MDLPLPPIPQHSEHSIATQRAEKGARGRKRANSDSEAARIILQEYLDWVSENK